MQIKRMMVAALWICTNENLGHLPVLLVFEKLMHPYIITGDIIHVENCLKSDC